MRRLFFVMIVFPKFVSKFIVRDLAPNKHMRYLVQSCEHIIKQRRESGQRANDFLQLLVDCSEGVDMQLEVDSAQSSEAHHVYEHEGDAKLMKEVLSSHDRKGSKTLSDIETVAGAIQFIVAGHETTSTLLMFAFYELALNPDKQDKLFEAVKSCAKFDYDSISSNEYLDAVVSETLRMHPPVVVLDREAQCDYTLPNTNIVLPKGTNVIIPVYAIHYDPENFEEPEVFMPERFLPENRHKIKPYTYLPFGE